jgi:hypothetical protein
MPRTHGGERVTAEQDRDPLASLRGWAKGRSRFERRCGEVG